MTTEFSVKIRLDRCEWFAMILTHWYYQIYVSAHPRVYDSVVRLFDYYPFECILSNVYVYNYPLFLENLKKSLTFIYFIWGIEKEWWNISSRDVIKINNIISLDVYIVVISFRLPSTIKVLLQCPPNDCGINILKGQLF